MPFATLLPWWTADIPFSSSPNPFLSVIKRGFHFRDVSWQMFARIFPPALLFHDALPRRVGRCIRRVRHAVDVRHRRTVIDDFLSVYSPASIIRVIGISILEPVSGQWVNEPSHRPRRSRNPSVACITPHRLWKWTIFKCDWNTREFGPYWVSIRDRRSSQIRCSSRIPETDIGINIERRVPHDR